MRITLEVSEKNEQTSEPWWVIIDPIYSDMTVQTLANSITGPFFSRESAEIHFQSRRYRFSEKAVVYCMSGCDAFDYKMAIRAARCKEACPEPIIIPTEHSLQNP